VTDTTVGGDAAQRVEGFPDHYSKLDAAEIEAWRMLEAGARSAKRAFHTPVLATVDAEGAPQARTVVLREADASTRVLRANTDQRSPKAAQLRHDSRVQMLFYDPDAKVQVRVTATAELLSDGPHKDAAWETSALGSRVCYLATEAPGSTQAAPTSGLPDHADRGQRVAADLLEVGRENFSVMRFHVEQLDWLYLDSKGHRRAQFNYRTGTRYWVIP